MIRMREFAVSSRSMNIGRWRAGSSRELGRTVNRQQIEKISKALADQTRLRIFEAISSQPKMTCGDIVSLRGRDSSNCLAPFKNSARCGTARMPKKGTVRAQSPSAGNDREVCGGAFKDGRAKNEWREEVRKFQS